MLAVVAPGQGAQRPGFLREWLTLPPYAAEVAVLSQASGIDLAGLGTTADEATLRDTRIAQPLIVAAGIAAASVVDVRADLLAGHSVGELTAAALSGALTGGDAVRLAAVRGRAMAVASDMTPTGMAAIVGGDRDEIEEAIAHHGLTLANDNGPGQVVAAGGLDRLTALKQHPPNGSRVIALKVAGAFHTDHMATAVFDFDRALRNVEPRDSQVGLLSNLDGAIVDVQAEVKRRLTHQIVRPVRWDLVMHTLAGRRVTGVLELPPAGTLTAFLRRGLPGVATCALTGPHVIDRARAFVDEHSTRGAP